MKGSMSARAGRCWLAAFLALASLAGRAEGAEKGTLDVAPVAEEVGKFLRRNGKDSVVLGQFRSPPQLNASAGPAIAKQLAELLADQGVTIKRVADWSVEGDFLMVEDIDEGGLTARVKGRVVDRSGMALYSGSWNVGQEAAIATLFGPTVELPLDQGEAARARALKESIESPKAFVQAARIAAGPKSPYAIEVYVSKGNAWEKRTPTIDDGLSFAPIERDEMYGVGLINDSDQDAAVTLTIDGLNMFAFSQKKEYRHVIVAKKSRGFIRGWHKTNDVSDAFLVTSYAKSAAAGLLSPDSAEIGTITARFAAAWPVGQPPPSEEQALYALRGGGDATGRGPEVKATYKEVERKVGSTRATVSVRYTKSP